MEPSILVMPTRYVRALDSNELEALATVETFVPVPISTAFGTVYETDAHFVQYLVSKDGEIETKQARLSKSVLPMLLVKGYSVEAHVIAIDYDNDGHGEWTPDLVSRFDDLRAKLPRVLEPRWFYRTKHGARLVYELHEPLPVARMENLYRGLVDRLANHGLSVDPRCADWTRLFRLPQIKRSD